MTCHDLVLKKKATVGFQSNVRLLSLYSIYVNTTLLMIVFGLFRSQIEP